jgi:hypothetical protein
VKLSSAAELAKNEAQYAKALHEGNTALFEASVIGKRICLKRRNDALGKGTLFTGEN